MNEVTSAFETELERENAFRELYEDPEYTEWLWERELEAREAQFEDPTDPFWDMLEDFILGPLDEED